MVTGDEQQLVGSSARQKVQQIGLEYHNRGERHPRRSTIAWRRSAIYCLISLGDDFATWMFRYRYGAVRRRLLEAARVIFRRCSAGHDLGRVEQLTDDQMSASATGFALVPTA